MAKSGAKEDPRITRSRSLILDAASEAFLEFGYDGTSVDDIAARAGVAKRTVYNIYGEKEELFRATLARSIAIAEQLAEILAEATTRLDDVGKDLPALAIRLADDVLLSPVLPLRRLLISESARFEDLARDYRDRAPDMVLRALAASFSDLRDRGLLVMDDPALAAEHFAFLVIGAELDRGMFTSAPPSPEQARRRAGEGARAFLRAYGNHRPAS